MARPKRKNSWDEIKDDGAESGNEKDLEKDEPDSDLLEEEEDEESEEEF